MPWLHTSHLFRTDALSSRKRKAPTIYLLGLGIPILLKFTHKKTNRPWPTRVARWLSTTHEPGGQGLIPVREYVSLHPR